MGEPVSPNEPDRKVWDLPVRITHWLLVVGIAGSYLTHKLGIEYFRYHLWFGYLVVVLAAFRILWGLVGTRHARFASFIRGPRATWRYAVSFVRGESHATPGHNPLGAWMVVLLLAALLAQGVTGLFSNDEIFNTGPLYGYISDELSLALTSWHRRLFDWILVAVALHMLAVVGHRLFAGHDLVGPMFSGRKPAALVAEHEAISSSRLWLATILLATLVGTIGWLVAQAPEPTVFGFE
jgi:cytochrome b